MEHTLCIFIILLACFGICDGVNKNEAFYAISNKEMQDVISVFNNLSDFQCGRCCLKEDGCSSFGFKAATGTCKLFDNDPLVAASDSIEAVGSILYVKDCKQGWLRFENYCYKFSTTHKTWVNAKAYCESLGASLAIVTSEEEHQFIRQTAAGKKEAYYLIGATYDSTLAEFRWIDGSEMTYNGWYPGQPVATSGCVDYLGKSDWRWNHYLDCDNTAGPFICEKERNT